MIFGINTTSDISKLLYVISRAVRWVKFETILKYHESYLCQIASTNHTIICLDYYWKSFVIFTHRYFKLSWNATTLSRSNCRNFSCSSIKLKGHDLRHEYLIKCAYFDKMLFRTVCFYQWSWKLNLKCSLMALAIGDRILEAQMFVTWLIIEN